MSGLGGFEGVLVVQGLVIIGLVGLLVAQHRKCRREAQRLLRRALRAERDREVTQVALDMATRRAR